ncbi:MAG TPA: urea carboxylase-associated family protein [Thermomicrobiales bacterium]|jgi:hypothetical protein|nr:urea carboxylase-associated family protein [Thermomicrobiales bacterium]
MGQSMVGRVAIKARQIHPGEAFAAHVPAGGLVEVVDLEGQQVAELVAFNASDPGERTSLGVTRQNSRSIAFQLGMSLYSSRGNAMLELVEDTVGRHDLLWSAATNPPASAPTTADDASSSDAAPGDAVEDETVAEPAKVPGAEAVPAGFAVALAEHDLGQADAPDPVNLFMNLGVMQKGDLEVREPTSERGDRVVLRAAMDLLIAVRCSSATDATNAGKPTDILVRVYR